MEMEILSRYTGWSLTWSMEEKKKIEVIAYGHLATTTQ
jgi:hypothetical protein